jgi:hypothetical protein
MTKRLSLISLLFISLFSACGDDEPSAYKCSECVDAPEANAAYDNTGRGIYKGVLIGSSGTIKFDIANNSTDITAVLEIDGESVTLTSTGTYDPATGFTGAFTGTMDGGAVSIQFTVTNGGTFQIFSVTIPGHSNVIFRIFKEKSTQLVEAFEGTYKGADSGTFNMVILRDGAGGDWGVITRSEDADYVFIGQIDDDQLLGGGGDIIIVGEINGDNIKGVWENAVNGATGTWTGKRTL